MSKKKWDNGPWSFQAFGKLMIAGEYVVLSGSKAFAIPTKLGQRLDVHRHIDPDATGCLITWESLDHEGNVWFEAEFEIKLPRKISIKSSNDNDVAQRLERILDTALRLTETHLDHGWHYTVTATLEFDRNWGLGSSSTLISLLGDWWDVDPFELLKETFGGSGYDIACARAPKPILYYLDFGDPSWEYFKHYPEEMRGDISFVFLGQKQNSREGIRHYKDREPDTAFITRMSGLVEHIARAKSSRQLGNLLKLHEQLLGEQLEMQPVQERLFADFEGQVTSLGAWGGDFVMCVNQAGHEATAAYMKSCGYDVCLRYEEILLV